jgi:aryl-alcohol dehydrogenase-like predicted oxidoreductase
MRSNTAVEERPLGRTGLRVSSLGFGCGNVGGLLVRGTRAERERAVARAIELGITYFDTAPSYGDGLSEQHLGEALRAVGADAVVGTKVSLRDGGDVERSLDASLERLGRDEVDLFQLHDPVGPETLERVLPALERMRAAGRTRFVGITGLGDTDALHAIVESGAVDTVQAFFNLLNPSAGYPVPAGSVEQDFRELVPRAHDHGVGVIVVRALAGGALSGEPDRHPVAAPAVDPIASGPSYGDDLLRAQALRPLVEEGFAGSLVEAALRFPLASEGVSTVLLGYSSLEQLEAAADAVAKGPLPPEALQLAEREQRLAGGGHAEG